MKACKRVTALLLSAVLIFMLSGCWDYQDVNKLFVVLGVAIDKDPETGEFLLAAEVVKAKKGTEAEIVVRITTSRGSTIFEAIRNAIQVIGAKLYWGHVLVIAYSNNIAGEDMIASLDTFQRLPQIKSDVIVCITPVKPIEDLFKGDDPIHDTLSQHISDLIEQSDVSGKFTESKLEQVIHDFSVKTRSVKLPYFIMKEEAGEKILHVDGCVAFKGNSMVGLLDEIETRSVLLLEGKLLKGYEISLPASDGLPASTLEVYKTIRKLTHSLQDGQLSLKLDFTLDCDVVEIETSDALYLNENRDLLETAFAAALQSQMKGTIEKAQREYKTDLFNFGQYVYTRIPNYFRTVESDWNGAFTQIPIEVGVKVNILSSSIEKIPFRREE